MPEEEDEEEAVVIVLEEELCLFLLSVLSVCWRVFTWNMNMTMNIIGWKWSFKECYKITKNKGREYWLQFEVDKLIFEQ